MNYFKLAIVRVMLLACLLTTPVLAAPPIRLTTDGRQKMDPVFVANGSAIIYAVQTSFDQISLMRLKVADRTSERFHPSGSTSELCATFSKDEQIVAFIRNNANLHVLLIIQNTATGSTIEHDPGGGFAGVRCVSMAPDGDRLLYAFPETEGEQQIFSLTTDGKTKTAITKGGGIDGSPRYSPDGRWIAFASTRDGNFDIFTMTASGEQLDRLTEFPGLDTRPAWSPDGKRIAFTSLRDGNYDIYVVDVDGTNLCRVTENPERDDFAWWHPDGKQLVVVSERDGKQDLYLISL